MDWTQIATVALTVLLGSGGVLVTIIQNRQVREKRYESLERELRLLLEKVGQLDSGLGSIRDTLKINGYATKKQIKYTLTRLHREALQRGYITRYELECAEDLFSEYIRLGGNSFVTNVLEEMRELPIRFPTQG